MPSTRWTLRVELMHELSQETIVPAYDAKDTIIIFLVSVVYGGKPNKPYQL
jgi:hypothetical protein